MEGKINKKKKRTEIHICFFSKCVGKCEKGSGKAILISSKSDSKLLYTGPWVYPINYMYSMLNSFRTFSSSALSFASFKSNFLLSIG